jgi:hypothetical protein
VTIECPVLLPYLVVADDPQLAAHMSCLLAVKGAYLPVIDGPRMQRPDGAHEVIRRNNGIARAGVERVVLAGVESPGRTAMEAAIPKRMRIRVDHGEVLRRKLQEYRGDMEPIQWGTTQIGVGLLKALRNGTTIEFNSRPSPNELVPSQTGHFVVCEEGEALSEVIAANYAFALGAGFKIIPEVGKAHAATTFERLYGLYATNNPQATFQAVRAELRALCGDMELEPGSSLTFFTRLLPFGIGFPDFPSTHLFIYPDVGLALINGFAAEQDGAPGVNVAVLIDPQTTEAGEIEQAARELAKRGTFVRVHQARGAEVTEVSDTVELYPYDLLIFATHCGDADGYRWTYEFTDSEGIARTLVVDIALGLGRTEDPDRLSVMEFMP